MSNLLVAPPRRSLAFCGLFFVLVSSLASGALSDGKCGPRLRNLQKLNARAPISFASPRLTIRTPRGADLGGLLRIFQDDETLHHTSFWMGTGYWTLDRLAALYERNAHQQRSGKRYDFVLVSEGHPATIVGRCALYEGAGRSWEFDVTIYRAYWGSRYAREVIRRVMEYAFMDLDAREVRFRTLPGHRAMLVQYDRLKIPKVIDASEDVAEAPTYRHYHYFALTRAEWDTGLGR